MGFLLQNIEFVAEGRALRAGDSAWPSVTQRQLDAAIALLEARKSVRRAKYVAALALTDASRAAAAPGAAKMQRKQNPTEERPALWERPNFSMSELENALVECDVAYSEFEDACGHDCLRMAAALGHALRQAEPDCGGSGLCA